MMIFSLSVSHPPPHTHSAVPGTLSHISFHPRFLRFLTQPGLCPSGSFVRDLVRGVPTNQPEP